MQTFEDKRIHAPKPTPGVLFWRTFAPWQAWRFLVINLKMMGLIHRSHAGR